MSGQRNCPTRAEVSHPPGGRGHPARHFSFASLRVSGRNPEIAPSTLNPEQLPILVKVQDELGRGVGALRS